MVTFVQVLSGLSLPKFNWPFEFKKMAEWLPTFDFSLDISGFGCVFGASTTLYFNRLLFDTCWPLAFFVVCSLPGLYGQLRKLHPRLGASKENREKLRTLFWRSLFFLTYLIYPSVSRTIIVFFSCDTVWAEEPTWHERRYLHVDYRIDCDSEKYGGYASSSAKQPVNDSRVHAVTATN